MFITILSTATLCFLVSVSSMLVLFCNVWQTHGLIALNQFHTSKPSSNLFNVFTQQFAGGCGPEPLPILGLNCTVLKHLKCASNFSSNDHCKGWTLRPSFSFTLIQISWRGELLTFFRWFGFFSDIEISYELEPSQVIHHNISEYYFRQNYLSSMMEYFWKNDSKVAHVLIDKTIQHCLFFCLL